MSPAKLLQFIRLPQRRRGATDDNDPTFELTFTIRRRSPRSQTERSLTRCNRRYPKDSMAMGRPIPHAPIGFRLAHELEGLLTGIRADNTVLPLETQRVRAWLVAAAPYRDIRPFQQLSALLEAALVDGVLTLDECDDLLFVTQKLTTVNPHFGTVRTGLQMLMAILAGITSDRKVDDAEAQALAEWLVSWSHLRGLWPYDECESIIASLLADENRADEIAYLFALAEQFPIGGAADAGERPPTVIKGVCAVDPHIAFARSEFVVTGESGRCHRDKIEQIILDREGIPHPRVTQRTDYLIVCDGGNPHWAFACYGRKVEHAYNLRREGHHILIVHEADFWDAIAN
jgi:hypothetical protein